MFERAPQPVPGDKQNDDKQFIKMRRPYALCVKPSHGATGDRDCAPSLHTLADLW